jgi:hypothetical protein
MQHKILSETQMNVHGLQQTVEAEVSTIEGQANTIRQLQERALTTKTTQRPSEQIRAIPH